jgi:predicted transcriptional regulator
MLKKTSVARLIRDARKRAGLSQRALARRAGTTQAVVARLELGEASPVVSTLQKLVDAAGFEIAATLRPKARLDRQILDDVPRILRLSPEDRLREVANISRFTAMARRVS